MMLFPDNLIGYAAQFGLTESAAMKQQRREIWSEPRDDAKVTQAISRYQALGEARIDSLPDVARPYAQIGLILLSAAIRSRLAETDQRHREQLIDDMSDAITYADNLPTLTTEQSRAIAQIKSIDRAT